MPTPDRRTTPRYPSNCLVRLAWRQMGKFCERPAQLRNISSAGAMVTVEEASLAQKKVWFCLAGREKTQWMSAEVLEVISEPEGSGSIRLRFPDSCLYEVFKSAAWGQAEEPRVLLSESSGSQPVQDSPSTPTMRSVGPASHLHASQARFPETALPTVRVESPASSRSAADSRQPRTLAQAHRENLVLQDWVAPLPWVVRSAICLLIVFLLGALAGGRFEIFQRLGMVLGLSH